MAEKTETQQKKRKTFELAVLSQLLTLATSGFGLVAALAWNNVIQEFVNNYIKKFLPGNSGIISLLLYAFVVTILAVVVTYNLSFLKEKLEE